MAAKSDTGQTRLGFPKHRAILARRGHLRVKRLNMRRPALQIKHHHALTGEDIIALTCRRARGKQLRQSQPTQPKRSNAQKLTPTGAFAVVN